MSSNQNNTARGRVKSIRKRLANQRVRMKIGIHFGQTLFWVIIMIIVWLAAREYMADTAIPFPERSRQITVAPFDGNIDSVNRLGEVLSTMRYIVYAQTTGKIILSEMIFAPVMIILSFGTALFAIELLGDLLSYSHEKRRVKRILKPLDELAGKVEEISKFELSEEKYHLIEEKITSLEPTDEAKLTFGDEDLKGIERAMNSLLTRIRESNRQQARFVNDASHELRTPIAVIEGYANMLARWGREDEKVLDESITAIQNESSHMKHLVEDRKSVV